MGNCKMCELRDEEVSRYAEIVNRLKREKMAYRAALIEIAGDADFKEVLHRHAERLGA